VLLFRSRAFRFLATGIGRFAVAFLTASSTCTGFLAGAAGTSLLRTSTRFASAGSVWPFTVAAAVAQRRKHGCQFRSIQFAITVFIKFVYHSSDHLFGVAFRSGARSLTSSCPALTILFFGAFATLTAWWFGIARRSQ
jgi:hypothetical protein